MRPLFGFICVLALSAAGCAEGEGNGGSGGDAGSGGDGGSGPPSEFVVGAPVTVSGATPFEGCEPPSEEPFNPGAEVEPWIVVNPTDADNMVGAWIQDPGLTSSIGTGVSFDGGATWESVVLPDSRCTGGDIDLVAGDPWLAFAANGDLYSVALLVDDFSFAVTEIHVNKSVDGGLTWGVPAPLVQGPDHDKPSISADPEDPCTVYVGWTHFTGGGGSELLLSRTTDCGETWSEPQSIRTGTSAPSFFQLVTMPDGTLVTFFRELPLALYSQRSIDGGETWSEPTVVTEAGLVPRAVSPDEDLTVRGSGTGFDVAVDRDSGLLAVVWQYPFEGMPLTSPIQIAFSSSTDGGVTWADPIRIDHTPSATPFTLEQAFIPSVEISDDGTVGVTYYNFENDTAGDGISETDYWFVHCNPDSTDCNDPEGWSDGLRLTPEPFDYLLAPYFLDGLFLGDYAGLSSQGSDFFALFSVTTEDDPGNVIFVPILGR